MLFSSKFLVFIAAVSLASSLVAAESVHKPDNGQPAPALSLHEGAKPSPAGMKRAAEAKHSSMQSGKPPASKPSGTPPASKPSGAPPSSKPQGEHSKRAAEAKHSSMQPGKPPASKPSGTPPLGTPPASKPSGAPPSSKPQGEHSKRAEEAANHLSRQPPKHKPSHQSEHVKN